MGFLKNLFGSKDPMDNLRKLAAHREWAALLSAAKRVDRTAIAVEQAEEVALFENEAGDQLASLNLEEGRWAQRNGELIKAREHFSLANEQARSRELKEETSQALSNLATEGQLEAPAARKEAPGHDCGSACGPSCAPASVMASNPDSPDLDEESRLELLMAALPAELAEQYQAAEPALRQAWLAIQGGDDRLAAGLLEQVSPSGRGALYFAERGALLARTGDLKPAIRDLQQALSLDPLLFQAFDTLVAAMARSGQVAALQQLLKKTIGEGRFVSYCWARLAELHVQKGEGQAALAAGLESLNLGENEPNLCVLCAQLLESEKRYDEAEQLLRRLPAGGCGGGIHPLLAEFLLRRGEQLGKALESFKSALRQERDNPRWPLRIAQVYLAKGWKKDAGAQLESLLGRSDLPPDLRAELQATVAQLQ